MDNVTKLGDQRGRKAKSKSARRRAARSPESPLPQSKEGGRARGQSSFDVDLAQEVDRLLVQIPAGRVTTFGGLARALGAVASARWIARYVVDLPKRTRLPRHRVVFRDGSLFRETGDNQVRRLRREGVPTVAGRVDLAAYGFDAFQSRQPLARLARVQQELAARIVSAPAADRLCLTAADALPDFVAGVDVSYQSAAITGTALGCAAYALIHVATGELVWSHHVLHPVSFPYIPGFLTFRELPILLDLIDEVRQHDRLAEVVLVDGNGRLHFRHAGIASHLGVAAQVATVGIGKSLLCGTVDTSSLRPGEARPVTYQGETVAQAIVARPAGRPIYVSPGHGVDLPFSLKITQALLADRRAPRPIEHAHRESRRAVSGGRRPRILPGGDPP